MENMVPMKYESLDTSRLAPYLCDDDWIVEQKVDGNRLLVLCDEPGVIRPLTTGGRTASFATARNNCGPVLAAIESAGLAGWALDGELIVSTNGGPSVYWLFDLPVAPAIAGHGPTSPDSTLADRRLVLEALYSCCVAAGIAGWGEAVRLVPQHVGSLAKKMIWADVVDAGAEGICLKRLGGKYLASGRQRSVDVVKAKIRNSVDCVVLERTTSPNAITVGLPVEGGWMDLGTTNMNGKCEVNVGDVVEIAYLYCQDRSAPKLTQSDLLGLRPDKTAADCDTAQLVFASKTVLA